MVVLLNGTHSIFVCNKEYLGVKPTTFLFNRMVPFLFSAWLLRCFFKQFTPQRVIFGQLELHYGKYFLMVRSLLKGELLPPFDISLDNKFNVAKQLKICIHSNKIIAILVQSHVFLYKGR